MFTSCKLSLIFLALFSLSSFGAVKLLEDAKAELILPEYTAVERKLVAEQAKFFISNLYVHRDLKVRDFGDSIDPVPRLTTLTDEAGGLENGVFHARMAKIFSDLHDLHTNYIAPRPLACGAAFHPIRFTGITEDGRNLVAVSQVIQTDIEALNQVKLGDVLLEMDGVAVAHLLDTLAKDTGGANAEAMRVRAIQMLSFRNGSSQALPEANSTILKLKNATGEYSVTVPWLAMVDDQCVNPNRPFLLRFWQDLVFQGEDEFQKRYNKVFSPSRPSEQWQWFGEEGLKEIFEVALIETTTTKIGYVQLKSFSWSNRNLDVPTIIDAFRHEVETALAQASGIIIDVRGNPGGHIVLAEKMIQLFTKEVVQPSSVQMLANELNEEIFLKANGSDNRWSEAIQNARAQNRKYTTPIPLTPVAEANSYGQVWFKPVLVLTDASCYSACDMFAAGMQDSRAAVIVGIHDNTGAGGANVMEYNAFRAMFGTATNNPFKKLPYGQNMRVSWRQSVRSGLHRGELIENIGVKSDVTIRLKKSDVQEGGPVAMMTQVFQELANRSREYTSGLKVRKGSAVYLTNGRTAKWKETVYGVDAIEFVLGNQVLGRQAIALNQTPTEVDLEVASLSGEWTDKSIVLVGKRTGHTVFRVVRELLWRGEYASIPEAGLKIDFENVDTTPLRTVQLKGEAGKGWQTVNGKLRIGRAAKYANSVLARATLPVKLSNLGATMILDLDLEAEEMMDSLRIYAFNPDTAERKNLFAGSNTPRSIRSGKIALPLNWERADVVFEFESDENWNMSGPTLDNVRILQ